MESERAEGRRPRWSWWMAVPIVIAAFGLGYGITKLANGDDSSETQPTPPAQVRGITFEQGHVVPLGISEAQLDQRMPGPPARVQRTHTRPPQTCRYYPLTDQQGVYVFCFIHGKLAVAHGGPTQ